MTGPTARDCGVRAFMTLRAREGELLTVTEAERQYDAMTEHDRRNMLAAYEIFLWVDARGPRL